MKTLGILGGGQLGRMLALSALPLGVRCRFLVPPDDAAVSALVPRTRIDDEAGVRRFASGLDAATAEAETLDARAVAQVDSLAPLRPSLAALDIKRDRRRERNLLRSLGLPQVSFAGAASAASLGSACERVGFPCRVKAAGGGYDGRAQWRVAGPRDVAAVPAEAAPFVVEAEIDFDGEFSLLAVRGERGQTRFWTPSVNRHEDGVLVSTRPDDGSLSSAEVTAGQECVRVLLDHFRYRGVLAVEFFRSGGGILVNELAPRVHNSGHWTIEGSLTSQFENHVRAVLALPLGDTALRCPVATWNVLGEWPDRAALLALPGVRVHDYGKVPRAGRKLGHVTLEASSAKLLAEGARRVERLLAAGGARRRAAGAVQQ